MKTLLVVAAFALEAAQAEGADFSKWWPDFKAAVARRDVAVVAQGAAFPMSWENGPIREIKSADDLKNRFDVYFTAEIQKMIATKKPEYLPNGFYIITWTARGNEYSMSFKPQGEGFALNSLSEGAP